MEYESNQINTQAAQKQLYAQSQVQMPGATSMLNRAVEPKAFDRMLGEQSVIRDQAAELAKLAEGILARIAGPRPEADCQENGVKDAMNGGLIGDLMRIQASTLSFISDARRALEQVAKYV